MPPILPRDLREKPSKARQSRHYCPCRSDQAAAMKAACAGFPLAAAGHISRAICGEKIAGPSWSLGPGHGDAESRFSADFRGFWVLRRRWPAAQHWRGFRAEQAVHGAPRIGRFDVQVREATLPPH